ncbi:hypothetical protein D3C87_1336460 [compost metagenome]
MPYRKIAVYGFKTDERAALSGALLAIHIALNEYFFLDMGIGKKISGLCYRKRAHHCDHVNTQNAKEISLACLVCGACVVMRFKPLRHPHE